MRPQLRAPGPPDYDAIASWVPDAAQCDRWAGPHMPFPFSGADLPRLMASAAAVVAGETAASFVLVADPAVSQQAVAFGQLVREDRTAFRLARIIVDPNRRGGGFGTWLCRLLIEHAETQPEAEIVKLRVYRDNAAAVRVYAGLGFVEAASHPSPQVMAMERIIRRS